MEKIKLGKTDIQVPILAMGAASLGGIYHSVSQQQANDTVQVALENNINYFDVAPYYGLTKAEKALGHALQKVPRQNYTLATKIGRYGDNHWDFSSEATIKSVEDSLHRLNVDYIDVIQCHDIEYGNISQLIDYALPTLRELKKKGLVRYIGITGYDLNILEKIAIEEQVDTVMAYCTYTLQDRRLAGIAKNLNEHGIGVLNASPLGMGLLTNKGAPSWHPVSQKVKEICSLASKKCNEYGEDISDVALQFALSTAGLNHIATTVIGTSSPENMLKNIACCDKPFNKDLFVELELILSPVINMGWDILKGNGGKAGK